MSSLSSTANQPSQKLGKCTPRNRVSFLTLFLSRCCFTDGPPNRWLFRLFLGQDANFRLKRLAVSSSTRDPGLNHGYAYFVEDTAFRQFIQRFDARIPDDVSNCNNHDALKLASMRGGKGLAASGIAAVDCSRHDMKRPVAVCDLYKGERYYGVDFSLYELLG